MSVEASTMVWKHSEATGTARLVLLVIADHEGDGGAWPSLDTIARHARVSRRTAQYALRELERMGELVTHAQDGGLAGWPKWSRPNRYEVTVTCPPWCGGGKKHEDTRGPRDDDGADTDDDSATFNPDTPGVVVDNRFDRVQQAAPHVENVRFDRVQQAAPGATGCTPGVQTAAPKPPINQNPVAKKPKEVQTARATRTRGTYVPAREARGQTVGDPAHPISAARAALQAAKEEQGAGVGATGRGFFDEDTPERPRVSKIPPDRPQCDETGTTETLCGDLSAVQTPDGESPQPTPESPAEGEYARFRGMA